jgi:uncharacterized protein
MRVLNGPSGQWCLGPGGTALLPHAYTGSDGALTPEGREALAATGIATAPAHPSHYSVTVVTSTDCNLGCPYCFQNTAAAEPGRFDPPRIPRVAITGGVIEQIADVAAHGMARLGTDELFVLLFGGEPLLNRQGCYAVLERLGRAARVRAAMVTNGVLLTPRTAARLEQLGLRSVQITLDGPAELHDQLRANRSGRGTFARIVTNLAAVQEATDLHATLRVNATPTTLGRLTELVDHLAAEIDPRRCHVDIAPVLNYDDQFDHVLARRGDELRAIVEAYDHALGLGFRVAAPGAGRCGFCSEERGGHGAVVNADGTLYSCWETIGREGWEVGHLSTGYSDYPPSRWVSCGDFADHSSAPAAETAFDDALTMELLELLRYRRLTAAEPAMVGAR